MTKFFLFLTDQLNTCVQSATKATPFELVFGQPPRSTVFPGVSGPVMEEDVEDLITEDGMSVLHAHWYNCTLLAG